MAVDKYVALQQITLTSSASSVTFGSIPQGYRDLRLVVTAHLDVGTDLYMRFNSDSGSNYSKVVMYGTGASAASSASTSTVLVMQYQGYPTTTAGGHVNTSDIMDYSQTDKHKTALFRGNAAQNGTDATAGRWASTSAITTIEIYAGSSRILQAGSTFKLFGVM